MKEKKESNCKYFRTAYINTSVKLHHHMVPLFSCLPRHAAEVEFFLSFTSSKRTIAFTIHHCNVRVVKKSLACFFVQRQHCTIGALLLKRAQVASSRQQELKMLEITVQKCSRVILTNYWLDSFITTVTATTMRCEGCFCLCECDWRSNITMSRGTVRYDNCCKMNTNMH